MKYVLKIMSVTIAFCLFYSTEIKSNQSLLDLYSLKINTHALAESNSGYSKVECVDISGTTYGVCTGEGIIACQCP